MASRFLRPSRVIAVVLVLGAVAWFAAGQLGGAEGEHAPAATTAEVTETAIPLQKVAVTTATPEQHERNIVLSCVTEADRRASAVARGGGVITELSVSRGTPVKAGDVIARLSDEGRAAALDQAQALLDQRLAEYEANKALIETGDAPRNTLAALEAAVAAARAALAAAQAEADRSLVNAPLDGTVDSVTFQVGQAVQAGSEIAVVVDPDPMLAVGQVSEARRALLEIGQTSDVRLIDGTTVQGTVDFIGLTADKSTRTYPVEATMTNADAAIADGVTCEMTVKLAPIEAAPVPRSALIFSDAGHLGVRIADNQSLAQFLPIEIVDDQRDVVWVTGISSPVRVIVVGQDFVRDGEAVEAVTSAEAEGNGGPPA